MGTTSVLLHILLLIGAMAIATAGVTYAAPLFQEEDNRIGLFGNVSALVDGTIILDTGQVVTTDQDTRFLVPGSGDASRDTLATGDRVAIVAAEFEDATLLARFIVKTPDEPVNNTHVIGVVTSIEDGLITLTDQEGVSSTLVVPEGTVVNVGDFLTIVSRPGKDADRLHAKNIATIDKVIDRLSKDIENATDKAVERLQRLLEENGDQRLTALTRAREKAPAQAKDALNAALIRANSQLRTTYQRAGAKGPFVRVRGFITAQELEGGTGTVTIDDIDYGEVILIVNEATEIDPSVAVGDFVKAKYNVDREAAEIELDPKEITFKGRITGFSEASLELDDITFVLNTDTEINGTLVVGAAAKVEALPLQGTFLALEINVTNEREKKEREKQGPERFEIIGAITALSSTELKVGGLTVVITPDTAVDGTLALNARVELEATLVDGAILAQKITVKGNQDQKKERTKSDIEFRGVVDSLSDTELVVDWLTVLLTPDTKIDGTISTGSKVEVKAIRSEGTLVAVNVEVADTRGKRVQKDADNGRGKANDASKDRRNANGANNDRDRGTDQRGDGEKRTDGDDSKAENEDDDQDEDEDDDDD